MSKIDQALGRAKPKPVEPEPVEAIIPPLFENAEPSAAPQPDPVPPGPRILSTEDPQEAPKQVPLTYEQQVPDLPAVRNRMADIRQDLNLVTNRLAQVAGYQSPELAQACIRATEFMVWMDMALQKAESEELARAAGFEVKQRDAGPVDTQQAAN